MKEIKRRLVLGDFEYRLLVGCVNKARTMFSQLVKQLAVRDGITEALKATDQMEWVRRMNAVRKTATEIVINTFVFI